MNKLNVFIGLSFSEIFTKFALFFLKTTFSVGISTNGKGGFFVWN